MYLKELYQYHKGWFLIVVLFIIGQLYINYKRGAVFSPFYHYGMFAAKTKPEHEYAVVSVNVNGKDLRASDFSPQEWDNITYPITLFSLQKENNSRIWRMNIKRILHLEDSSKYISNLTETGFNKWYQSSLKGILGYSADSVKIANDIYRFDASSLHLLKTSGASE